MAFIDTILNRAKQRGTLPNYSQMWKNAFEQVHAFDITDMVPRLPVANVDGWLKWNIRPPYDFTWIEYHIIMGSSDGHQIDTLVGVIFARSDLLIKILRDNTGVDLPKPIREMRNQYSILHFGRNHSTTFPGHRKGRIIATSPYEMYLLLNKAGYHKDTHHQEAGPLFGFTKFPPPLVELGNASYTLSVSWHALMAFAEWNRTESNGGAYALVR